MSIQRSVAHGRLTAALGVGSVAVSLGGIFLAAVLSPWFSPFRDALSDLGAVGASTAPLFNGALLVSAALGAGFVAAVWEGVDDPVRTAGLVFLLPAMVCMGLVGAFPLPGVLHGLVAVSFFFFMTVGVFVWGAGDFSAGRPERGGALVLASTLHVAAWLWWAVFGWPGPGIAVPELVGSGALATWALWLSYDSWPEATERTPL